LAAVRCGMARSGEVWYGKVGCGVVWPVAVRFGLIWWGSVWYGMAINRSVEL